MERAHQSPNSLARRQALLAALAVFFSAIIVGGSVYLSAEAVLRSQLEQRFQSLAVERENQVDIYLDAQAAIVRQITSRTRLRQLLVELSDSTDESTQEVSIKLAARILRDAIQATDNFERIDVIDSSRTIIASNQIDRFGLPFTDTTLSLDDLSHPVMIANFSDGRIGSPSLVAAPIDVDGEHIAVALVSIDTEKLLRRIASTRNTPPTAGEPTAGEPLSDGTLPDGTVSDDPVPEDPVSDGFAGRTLITNLADENGVPDQLVGNFRPSAKQGFERVAAGDQSFLVYWRPIKFAANVDSDPTFWAILSTDVAFRPLRRLRSLLVGIVFLATFLNACIAYVAARKTEVRLNRLARAAREIVESGFSGQLNVPDDSTFNALASAFDEMSGRAKTKLEELQEVADHEREEHSKLNSEIAIARQIQQCLYPDQPLQTGAVEVQGRSIPADTLCGDYFDYFVSGQEVVFAIGDVSGHGIGPALLMVEIRGVIRGLQWDTMRLSEVVDRLNQLLTTGVPSGRFVTLVLGRIDLETGHVEYVSAGHRAYVVRVNGSIEPIQSNGLPVGLVEDATYEARGLLLSAGESLMLASDGIEETQNQDGELLGRDRVLKAVANSRHKPLANIIDAVLNESETHGGERANADDRTMMILRWGRPPSR